MDWTCLAGGGGRCPRAGATQLLQVVQQQEMVESGYPSFLARNSAAGQSPTRQKADFAAKLQTSCRKRLGKDSSGTNKESSLSKLQNRQRLGSH